MKKITKVCYIPFYGAPKKDGVFNENIYGWEYSLRKNFEKKSIEIHTNDLLSIKESDACLIFDNIFYSNLNSIWEMYYQKKLHNSVYIDYEPPTGHCKNHSQEGLKRLSKIFKHIVTYNDDIVDNDRIVKGNIANFYSKEITKPVSFNKKKLVTMITSYINNDQIINILNNFNNTSYYNSNNIKMHPNELYSQREVAAKYFAKRCPDDFDLYGYNWNNEFDLINKGPLNKEKKNIVLSNYKFIISYDSFSKQNGYISEKIFDAFRSKVVPIYWGADNITDYIPKQCFIDKRDFDSYDELYHYMKNMSEEDYNKKIDSINAFLKSETYNNLFSSNASANILEKCLTDSVKDYSYEEAYKNLMWFESKYRKTQKNKKVNFYLSSWENEGKKININFVYYNDKGNIDFKLFVNGKENTAIFNSNNEKTEECRFERLLNYEIYCDKFPVKIYMKYYSNNNSKKLYLYNYNSSFSDQHGLFLNRRKNILYYYNDLKSK